MGQPGVDFRWWLRLHRQVCPDLDQPPGRTLNRSSLQPGQAPRNPCRTLYLGRRVAARLTNLFSKNGVPVARSAGFRTFSGRRISGSIRMRWGLVPSSSEQLRGAGNCRQGPTTVSNQPWDPPTTPNKKSFAQLFQKRGHTPQSLRSQQEPAPPPTPRHPRRSGDPEPFLCLNKAVLTETRGRGRPNPGALRSSIPPTPNKKSFAQLFQKRVPRPLTRTAATAGPVERPDPLCYAVL